MHVGLGRGLGDGLAPLPPTASPTRREETEVHVGGLEPTPVPRVT